MKKRVLTVVLLAFLVLTCAFAACGGNGEKGNKTATYTVVVSGGSGSGNYEKGTVITVVADDLQNKRFVEWNINDTRTSADKTLTITVDGNMFLEAVYVDIYTLSVVGGSGSGIYDGGSVITVSANVPDGKVFKCWESDGEVYSYDNPLSITLNSDLSISAVIAEQATVNVTDGNGSGVYPLGATAIITANVPDGKIFAYWLLNGEKYSEDYYLEYTADRAQSDFTPVFADPVRLTVNGGSGNGLYIKGATVTVVPIEPEWMSFVRWEIDGVEVSTDRVCSFVIDEDTEITAVFTDVIQRALTVIGGIISGGEESVGVFADGDIITVESIVPENLNFLNWTVNGAIVSTDDPYTFTITSDMTITANFIEIYLQEDFKLSAVLLDSYEKGKILELPSATFKSSTATISVKDPDGDDVELISEKYLSLNKAGAYVITYTADKDNRVKVARTLNSVVNLPVITSSDLNASLTLTDTEPSFHKVSNWNMGTTLTFNKIADFSVLGNMVLISPKIDGGFSTSTFDYISIKLIDYKNPENVIEIRMYDDPIDTTKYHFAAYLNDVKQGEAVSYNGGGQCNIWIKYMETAGNKFNPIQLWLGGIGNNDSHIDLTDFVGFTDDKAIITVSAVNWHVDFTTILFDYFMDIRDYNTDLSDLYAVFENSFLLSKSLLDNYEQGHAIELPAATIGGNACTISAYYGGNPVEITDGKLYFAEVGEYTIRYSSVDYPDIYKEITLNAVATLDYITSSDGATTYGTSGTLATIADWNKDTVLTVNKVADVSGASFSGNYLICQPNFGASSIGAKFGSFVIKLTDYKDADNYLTITIYDVEDKKVNARVQVNGEDYTTISYVHFEGNINVIFDYAEKKVALGNKVDYVTINGFSGFTDGKCIITMYAEDWVVDSTDIAFDWITDSRTYATNLSDLYCD